MDYNSINYKGVEIEQGEIRGEQVFYVKGEPFGEIEDALAFIDDSRRKEEYGH
jgi:hypothetical protein